MTDTSSTLIVNAAAAAATEVFDKVASKLGQSKAKDLKPVIDQYGPTLAAMSAAEIWAWIDLAVKGDPFASYAALVAKMPNQELVDQWATLNADWKVANKENSLRVAWQRDALTALLKGLVTVAASLVVL